jgi:hypothetical protein
MSYPAAYSLLVERGLGLYEMTGVCVFVMSLAYRMSLLRAGEALDSIYFTL